MDKRRVTWAIWALVAIVALALLLSPGLTGTASAAIEDNLISCWDLDESSGTRVDYIGSNDLTDNNTVGSRAGVVGNAADFTAANSEWLSHVSNESLQLGDVGFTIAAWFYADGDSNRIPLSKEGEYYVKWDAPVKLRFYLGDGGSTYEYTNEGGLSTGAWYFMVMWHDPATNTMYQSLNDGTPESNVYSLTPGTASTDFLLGKHWASVFYWDGGIDQVVIWERILSSAEITDMYNSGSGRPCSYVANAATPTPTLTPTPGPGTPDPDYIQDFTLSTTGNAARIERSLTYGDIAITIGLLFVGGSVTLGLYMLVTKQWLQ